MKTKTLNLFGFCLLIIAAQSCSTIEDLNNSVYPSSYQQIHNKLVKGERTSAGPIRLVVDTGSCRTRIGGIDTRGKVVASTEGMLGGAVMGLYESAEYFPTAIILVPAGAAIGGIAGAAYTADKDEITALIQKTDKTIASMNPGRWLSRDLYSISGIKPGTMVGGYATPAAAQIQDHSILHIKLLSIGCGAANYDPHFFTRDVVDVTITIQVELKRASDQRILYAGHYFYRSKATESRGFEEWTANNSQLLLNEIRIGMHRIAESVLTDVFQCPRPQLARIHDAPDSLGAGLTRLACQKDAGEITHEEYQLQLKNLLNRGDLVAETDH